jgi:hypothetical protein
MQQVYRDIKQTLGVPIVNSDYQALARWSAFFLPAWEDIKLWRERPEYQLLKQDIVRRAETLPVVCVRLLRSVSGKCAIARQSRRF